MRGNENVRLYLGTFRKHIQDRVALNPKSTYLQYTVLSVDFYRQYLCRHSGKEYRKAHPLNRGTHSAASRDMKPKVDIATVDLFCGVGGLSLGLQKAGFRIVAGIDLDPSCKSVYERNISAPFLLRDVALLEPADLRALYGDAKIRALVACAPCQPFSGYTTKRRKVDDRWQLLNSVARLAVSVKPEIITVENVARLAKLPLWSDFVEALLEAGYQTAWNVVDSSDFGVPQKRRRLVLIASLIGGIIMPKPITSRCLDVRRAIGHLPPVAAGEVSKSDRLHVSRNLTSKNKRRMIASKCGGTWRDWPRSLRVDCHVRETGRTYPSVYGRMEWDEPAPTITTQFYGFGNGRFGHPDQDRALTLREGALLQTFPESFEFLCDDEKVNFNKLGRLIGNAVPPALAKVIGQHLMNHAANA